MNALEAVEAVYQHLKTSVLFTDAKKPNGNLSQFQRKPGSKLEDVVVNSISLNRRPIQEGVLNVNLFVPNEGYVVNGAWDYSRPNLKRLNELTLLAEQALTEVWHHAGKYTFTVQQDTLHQDENDQHYQQIRVAFNKENIT